MDNNFSSKKYFIYGFKKYITNDNKILSKKFIPSIREVMCDYLEIYEDINKNKGQEKLEKSRTELLEAMKFFTENSIFFQEGIYRTELKILIDHIKTISNCSEDIKILKHTKTYNMCMSLVKKFNKDNIYFHIVNIIKESKNFSQIDNAIEAMISELLYNGYSLKYLDVWFNENIGTYEANAGNIDNLIDKFQDLKKEKDCYTYYISILSKQHTFNNELYWDYNLKVIKQDYEELSLIDTSTGKNIKNYLQYTNDYDIFRIEIYAMDVYKGLEILVNAFNSYYQMINYLKIDDKIVLKDKSIVKLPNDTFMRLRIESYDEKTLFANIESRERQDIQDFIRYRDNVYSSMISSDEISNIQRAINIVKGQNDQSQESRLINLWAILEYILTFHDGVSIISKVKEIIPKIVCLYSIKDKLNVFWNRLFYYKDSDISIVKEFIEKCKRDDDDYYYDLDKLIEFVLNKGPKLIKEFNFNDVLKRDIAQIGDFLTNPESRSKYITKEHDKINNDLVRIYRARNVLIHSGKKAITNLDYKSLRLYQYNNNLLGVIIYYKKKNPYSTITEILNSIDYTYTQYLEMLNDKVAVPLDICKPKYLFIG